MIGTVAEFARAGRQHGEARRIARRGTTLFVANRALHGDAGVSIVHRAHDAHLEGVVLLLVQQAVGADRGAQHMRHHPVTAQRDGVLGDVEQGAVVVRPHDVGLHIGDRVAQHAAGGEILDLQHILAPADDILGPCDQFIVGADLPFGQGEEAVALGHRRLVEHQFGRGVRCAAPFDHRIIGTRGEARLIPPAIVAVGDAAVILLDVRHRFFVQPGLQRLQRGQPRIGIAVLRIRIGEHLRIFAAVIAQPVIIVLAHAVGRRDLIGLPGRARRFLRGGGDADHRRTCHHQPHHRCVPLVPERQG